MSTAEEFAQHLALTTGAAVYTSKLPAKPNSADNQWSVVGYGGIAETGGNNLLWKRVINLRVSYRHKKTQAVYDADALLSDAVGSFQPSESSPVLSHAVIPMTDTDEDAEGRHTASWQLQLTVSIK